MRDSALDTYAPPADLDVLAARRARDAYRAALARGLREEEAWERARSLFALHHPAWPLPLAEREAVRTVGALIAGERMAAPVGTRIRPPLALLRRLAAPEVAGDLVGAPAPDAAGPFRRAWRLPVRASVPRLPLRRIEDLRGDPPLPHGGALQPSHVPQTVAPC